MALLLTSALFSLVSCEDTSSELGLDLPGTAPINTEYEDFPAWPVQAFTIRQDSLATTQKDHFLVGRVTDGNTGGTVEARAFLELAASTDSLPSQYAARNPKLDSVVILASFDRVYGSAIAPLRLSVNDLQQPLDDFTPYNSTSEVPLGAPIVTSQPVKLSSIIRNRANSLDSVVARPLRIPLSTDTSNQTAFARQVFAKLLSTNKVTLSDADLRTVWKGLGIAATTQGTAVAFNRSLQSAVYVYYHLPSGTNQSVRTRKRKAYRILFGDPNGSTAAPRYFTNIRYTLGTTGSPFNVLQGNVHAQVPASASSGVVYAQDGTGLTTKLIIPGLDTLRNRQAKRNLIINRAELIVPLAPYSIGQFAAPSQLYLYEANSANNRILIYRNGLNQTERLVQANGSTTPTAAGALVLTMADPNAANKVYTALMTSYVQAYITNQVLTPAPSALFLSPTRRRAGGELSLDRAAIDARNIKLRVYYSKTTAR